MSRFSEADFQGTRKNKQIVKLEIRLLKEIIGIEDLCCCILDFYLLPPDSYRGYRDSTFKLVSAQSPSFLVNKVLLFCRQDDRRQVACGRRVREEAGKEDLTILRYEIDNTPGLEGGADGHVRVRMVHWGARRGLCVGHESHASAGRGICTAAWHKTCKPSVVSAGVYVRTAQVEGQGERRAVPWMCALAGSLLHAFIMSCAHASHGW